MEDHRCLTLILPFLSLEALVLACLSSKKVMSQVLAVIRHQPRPFRFEVTDDDCCASGIVSKLLRQSPRKVIYLSPAVTDFGLFHLGVSLSLRTFPSFPSSYRQSMEIDLSQCSRVTDTGMECLLNAHGTTMTIKPLNITSLNLSGVWRITDKTIELLGKLPQLESVHLARCYKVCDSETRLTGLRGLKHIDLTGISNVTHSQTLGTLCENNPDLETLFINRVDVTVVSDGAMQYCASILKQKKMEKLHTVAIEGAYILSDAGLSVLGEIAPNLKSLSLSHCRGVTSLQSLGDRCLGNLERLELNGCRNTLLGDDKVVDQLKTLRHLEYRHSELDDSSILSLSGLKSTLQSLALTGNKAITQSSVGPVVSSMTRLREIHLGGCEGISSEACRQLMESLDQLQTVQLPPDCEDAVLLSLVNKPIRHLDLGKSKKITDEALATFVEKRSLTLEHLRLDETLISDSFLSTVSVSNSLRRISAYGCINTSPQGFEQLDSRAPFTLQTLMDREGRMVRCPCCCRDSSGERSACSGGGGQSGSVIKRRGRFSASELNANRGDEVSRFISIEVPMIVFSCAAIAADWFFALSH